MDQTCNWRGQPLPATGLPPKASTPCDQIISQVYSIMVHHLSGFITNTITIILDVIIMKEDLFLAVVHYCSRLCRWVFLFKCSHVTIMMLRFKNFFTFSFIYHNKNVFWKKVICYLTNSESFFLPNWLKINVKIMGLGGALLPKRPHHRWQVLGLKSFKPFKPFADFFEWPG